MRKNKVTYYCDRCEKEISQEQHDRRTLSKGINAGEGLNITFTYNNNNKEITNAAICNRCLKDALKSLVDELE